LAHIKIKNRVSKPRLLPLPFSIFPPKSRLLHQKTASWQNLPLI